MTNKSRLFNLHDVESVVLIMGESNVGNIVPRWRSAKKYQKQPDCRSLSCSMILSKNVIYDVEKQRP